MAYCKILNFDKSCYVKEEIVVFRLYMVIADLLTTGSEQRGVLEVGSIPRPVAILPSSQDVKDIT